MQALSVRPVSSHAAMAARCPARGAVVGFRAPAAPARRALLRPLAAAATEGQAVKAAPPPPITLSDAALAQCLKLRAETGGEELLLRVGVKSGGCSGMSYVMDFEKQENVAKDDIIIQFAQGFRAVCDSKSLLYIFGMQLDYSHELIGGGFAFKNPSAAATCGCGKSFNV